MKKKFFLGLVYLVIFASVRCVAQDCPEIEEGEDEEDYSDLYPYCDNIDSPLDEGTPLLIVAGIVFGIVYKRNYMDRKAVKADPF